MKRLFFPKWNSQMLATSESLPTCLLDGAAKQCHYHAASPLGTRPYDDCIFDYIGDGVVNYVGGVKQPGTVRLSFFRLKFDRPALAR